MHASRRLFRLSLGVFTSALLLHAALLTSGCDGGGSGPDGRSTIQGTVDSFSVGGAFYMPRQQESRLMAWAVRLLDVVIPQARAAVEGVVVELEGTGLRGTTDDRGFFILSGAPGGDRVLRFSYNGQSAGYALSVPGNGVVTLDRVRINDDSVGVGRVSVVESPDDNGNDNQSGNANSNANGNQNRNGNDNDDDDNGNDNDDDDNVNGNANSNQNANNNANANDNDDDDDDDDDDDNRNDNRR